MDDKEWSKVKINIFNEDEDYSFLVNDEDETLFSQRPYHKGDTIGLDHMDKTTKLDRNGSGAIFIRG